MNLTEPHCGTDLGLTKTIAYSQEDGSYKITGTKIFITCGEHDMSENIIHLVLAKTPNAPEGIKGISLFIVPKIIRLGDRHALRNDRKIIVQRALAIEQNGNKNADPNHRIFKECAD